MLIYPLKNKDKVKVKDIVDGYTHTHGGGVKGYNGNLNIRPDFQRELVYKEQQMQLVIDSMLIIAFYTCKTIAP